MVFGALCLKTGRRDDTLPLHFPSATREMLEPCFDIFELIKRRKKNPTCVCLWLDKVRTMKESGSSRLWSRSSQCRETGQSLWHPIWINLPEGSDIWTYISSASFDSWVAIVSAPSKSHLSLKAAPDLSAVCRALGTEGHQQGSGGWTCQLSHRALNT